MQLPPELDLLLCCSRSRIDAATAARMRELAPQIGDWQRVVKLAGANHLLPVLYRGLNSGCADLVPADVLNSLRGWARGNSYQNLLLMQELIRLVRLFAANGIEAIPFKGPALALDAYGDLALRQAGDLDILVRPADAHRALDLLAGANYEATEVPVSQAQRYFPAPLVHTNLPLVNSKNGVMVELHWQLFPRHLAFPLSADDLWQRSRELKFGGPTMRIMAREDLLIVLCVHGAKHQWEALRWICDVAELLRDGAKIDWDVLLRRSAELRTQRILFLGLRLARDLFGAPLPPAVERLVEADRGAAQLARLVIARFVKQTGDPDAQPDLFGRSRFYLRMREHGADRARYLLASLFLPDHSDVATLPLPNVLFPVYMLVHPLRLAARSGRQVTKQFRRSPLSSQRSEAR